MTTSNEEQLAGLSSKSLDYIEQYKLMHKSGYTGRYEISPTYSKREHLLATFEKHAPDAKSLLDYGCAAGNHWTEFDLKGFLGIEKVTLYDPAVEKYSQRPTETSDIVICIDVMEHIPEEDIDWVIEDILNHANTFVYFRVEFAPAHALLPSGENAHVTVRPFNWWKERIAQHSREGLIIEVNNTIVS